MYVSAFSFGTFIGKWLIVGRIRFSMHRCSFITLPRRVSMNRRAVLGWMTSQGRDPRRRGFSVCSAGRFVPVRGTVCTGAEPSW